MMDESSTEGGASEDHNVYQSVTQRPIWPYEEWVVEEIHDTHGGEGSISPFEITESNTQCCSNEKQNDASNAKSHMVGFKIDTDPKSEINDTGGSEDDSDELPDHLLLDSLDEAVSEEAPITKLIKHILEKYTCDPDQIIEIKHQIIPFMESTLEFVRQRYRVFNDSTVQLVGSMAENTKMSKPDECDFAVLLPALGNHKIYYLLDRNDELLDDEFFNNIVSDIEYDSDDKLLNLQHILKSLWFEAMKEMIPDRWRFQESARCHEDDVSIAGTFHMIRIADEFQLDLDVCFWIKVGKEVLEQAPDTLIQRDYLLKECMDDSGSVYAMLPRDEGIYEGMNSVRFATSFLEARAMNAHGQTDGRIKCYRLAKSIASLFLPKIKKRPHCNQCLDGLVSSFCLKHIVLYMIQHYQSDSHWTDEHIGNRLVEMFAILGTCIRNNLGTVSAYFSPYTIKIDDRLRYDPKACLLVSTSAVKVYYEDSNGEQNLVPPKEVPCITPKPLTLNLIFDDEKVRTIVDEHFRFLQAGCWSIPEVFCRLEGLLYVLREGKYSERMSLIDDGIIEGLTSILCATPKML